MPLVAFLWRARAEGPTLPSPFVGLEPRRLPQGRVLRQRQRPGPGLGPGLGPVVVDVGLEQVPRQAQSRHPTSTGAGWRWRMNAA